MRHATTQESVTAGFRKHLDAAVARARADWPMFQVDAEQFGRYLVPFVNADQPRESLEKLVVEDLYLAFACLSGDEHALTEFEDCYLPLVRRNVSKLNIGESGLEEIVQRFRYKLFVRHPNGGTQKLATYNGSAKLSSWLRVVALRQALDFVKAREQKELPLTDAAIADQIAECDQEILLIKKRYRVDFEQGLKEALARLNERDRSLLRAQVLDKMSIDQLAKAYHVHRATAARWLVRIRTTLKKEMRLRLKRELDLNSGEYQNIANVLLSQINLSLSRILGPSH